MLSTALALLATGATARAQCGLAFQPGYQIGANRPVSATVWDPDGPGPSPSALVAAEVPTDGISDIGLWQDPAWHALGGLAPPGETDLLVTSSSGALLAASWNPGPYYDDSLLSQYDPVTNTWHSLGNNVSSDRIRAFAELPNGDLVVAGNAGFVLRWAGGPGWLSHSSLGADVYALAVLPGGELVAGGAFAGGVARWNNGWQTLGGGVGATVRALTVTTVGELIVGGEFTTAGAIQANRVARWDGAAWSALGSGCNAPIHAVAERPNGDLVVGGDFTSAGGNLAPRIARWDGAAWHGYHNGMDDRVTRLDRMPNGDLVAIGNFEAAGDIRVNGIARWSNGNWHPFGRGIDGTPYCVTQLANGELVAGGSLPGGHLMPDHELRRFDGSAWRPISGGVQQARGLAGLPNGHLVAAGYLPAANAGGVVQWDGTSWATLGVMNWPLVVLPTRSGDLVVGGTFTTVNGAPAQRIARWDGSAWHTLGTGLDGGVFDLAELPGGDLIVGGDFTMAGGQPASRVARWDGTSWHALGTGVDTSVRAAVVLADGSIVVGGYFAIAGGLAASRIARWDGVGWSPLGAGIGGNNVLALAVLPNGDLLVGGEFTHAGGVGAGSLARWDGSAWSGFGGGLTIQSSTARVRDIEVLADGEVLVGGDFAHQDDGSGRRPARGVTILATDCPATVATLGGGCPSSGGANQLGANGLPWLGATWNATASGLPTTGLAGSIFGLGTTSVPLQSLDPSGAPGCDLLVTPDAVAVLVLSGTAVTTSLALPAATALAGIELHHQVLVLELDPQGAPLALTATNGLELTLGAL